MALLFKIALLRSSGLPSNPSWTVVWQTYAAAGQDFRHDFPVPIVDVADGMQLSGFLLVPDVAMSPATRAEVTADEECVRLRADVARLTQERDLLQREVERARGRT